MIYRGNFFDVQAFLRYQEKWLQYSPKTINRKWAHLRHLLNWADDIPFQKIASSQKSFPKYLRVSRNDGKAVELSPASMQRACLEARTFLKWGRVHLKNKYKSIPEDWIETIRPSRSRGMQSELRERKYFSLEDIRKKL